jgi:hypothetical protein
MNRPMGYQLTIGLLSHTRHWDSASGHARVYSSFHTIYYLDGLVNGDCYQSYSDHWLRACVRDNNRLVCVYRPDSHSSHIPLVAPDTHPTTPVHSEHTNARVVGPHTSFINQLHASCMSMLCFVNWLQWNARTLSSGMCRVCVAGCRPHEHPLPHVNVPFIDSRMNVAINLLVA